MMDLGETDVAAGRSATDPAGRGRDFEEFYQADYARLAGQLYAYLGDAAEAEDVVQEAYLRAWQRWSDLRRYEDPVAWVRRVAWNLATSRLRRIATSARILRRHRAPEPVAALGPERVALMAALAKLPDRQRQAMVLYYVADLPVADIAAQLGAPKGTVVSWLSRARAQLAHHFTDAFEGGNRDDRAGA